MPGQTTIGVGTATALATAICCACGSPGGQSDQEAPAAAAQYPDPRGYMQLLFHPPSGQVILYGGEGKGRVSLNDVWGFDVPTRRWRELETEMHPAHGAGGTAAYDAESDRIIVYFTTVLDASAERGLARISETWAFDVARRRWTNMQPDPAPFGLMGARMVYDAAADRIVLFGGADFTRESAPRFNETWAYDFNSNSWMQRRPGQHPPGRSYYGMAYDDQADKTLIFGGTLADDAEDRAGEMWAYDYSSNTWEQLAYTGDAPSDHHPTMVYAHDLNKTLYLVNQSFWAFDYATRSWTQLPYDETMGVRHFHGMAFDDRAQRLVVFGGGPRGLRYDNQTWIFDPASTQWRLSGPGEQ